MMGGEHGAKGSSVRRITGYRDSEGVRNFV